MERAARLYEPEPEGGVSSHRLGLYVKRWCRRVHAGLVKLGREYRDVEVPVTPAMCHG